MTDNQQPVSRFDKPMKQWVKTIVWCLIYTLFIVWVGNFWWLLLLPVIFDAFITKIIPWTWWKNSKNKTVRTIMSWVDAIVFALVAVYFINTFLFQNYQIPTSSLEKTLLVGDFLFVSKASYGPRVPMTPLSFPLVQHTFPVIDTKSYFDNPQWKYRRLKGFDTIDRDDIVVFNFPTGDTVAVKQQQNGDYYYQCYKYGRDVVNGRKDVFGELIYRPVDRRENYVKRCVGLPGDTLQIIDNQIYTNGQPQEKFDGIQFNYYVQTDGINLNTAFDKLGISKQDRELLSITSQQAMDVVLRLGLDPSSPIYSVPLTSEMHNKLESVRGVVKIVIEPDWLGGEVFPLGGGKSWSRDNFGPIYIPKRGATIELNEDNFPVYERAIRVYENNKLEVKNGQYYINDVQTNKYTFQMDYFWMMGDNRHNSFDSRNWGFVPEDHVVGRPVFVWLSLDKDKAWFKGKIRWNRFFKDARR